MPKVKESFIFGTFFFVLCLSLQIIDGAYGSDWGQTNDEAAHFVTSLMIHDYLFRHLGENPLQYAKAYYQHFPRVALGHWPPMFELTEAIVFVIGRTGFVAIVFQAVIAGLFAGLPAAVVQARLGLVPAIATGGIVFFSPYALFLTNTVMADNFLGVLIFLASLTWENFYRRRTWRSSLLFAATASAAILTKGSAFALGIFPIVDVMIRRDRGFIASNKTVLSGVLVALATIPWYVATHKYAVDGFNYAPGWNFTSLALPKYTIGIISSIGPPVALGYAVGVYQAVRYQAVRQNSAWIITHTALSLAIIIFDCIVPADITIRYLIPALPSMAIVAVSGLQSVFGKLTSDRSDLTIVRTLGIPFCILVSIATIYQTPRIQHFRAREIVALIDHRAQPNPLVLVSGGVEAEGAIIAAFAESEATPRHYVIRGTKVLASGDFMGKDYRARFDDASDMTQWIEANKIGYIIQSTDPDGNEFSHNQTLAAAIEGNKSFYTEIALFKTGRGDVSVYQTPNTNLIPAAGSPIFKEIELHK